MEIGAGTAQALAGNATPVAALKAAGTAKENLGPTGQSSVGESGSFQSHWRSILPLLGEKTVQPAASNAEMTADDGAEEAGTAGGNTLQAPQRVIARHTGLSVQTAAGVQPSAALPAFSTKAPCGHSLPNSLSGANAAADAAAGNEPSSSSPSSRIPSPRTQEKQTRGSAKRGSTASGADLSTTFPATAPIPVFAPMQPIARAGDMQSASTLSTSVQLDAAPQPGPATPGSTWSRVRSRGTGAAEEFAAPMAKGQASGGVPANPRAVSNNGVAGAESGGAAQSAFRDTTDKAPGGDSAGRSAAAWTLNSGSYASRVLAGAEIAGQSSKPEQQPARAGVPEESGDFDGPRTLLTGAEGAGDPAAPAQTALRPQRANGSGEIAAPSPTHSGTVQSIATADAAAWSHSAEGIHGGAHAVTEGRTAVSGAASSSSREAFSALDAEPGSSGPAWIHVSAQHAEAGFNDPALGWVGVRADLGPGGVHAAIVPGSADAAQALSGHMAGLSAHLTAEHIPVGSLSMATTAGHESLGSGHGPMQQGSAQDQGQGAQQQSPNSISDSAAAASSNRQSNAKGTSGDADTNSVSARAFVHGNATGMHISVMA